MVMVKYELAAAALRPSMNHILSEREPPISADGLKTISAPFKPELKIHENWSKFNQIGSTINHPILGVMTAIADVDSDFAELRLEDWMPSVAFEVVI